MVSAFSKIGWEQGRITLGQNLVGKQNSIFAREKLASDFCEISQTSANGRKRLKNRIVALCFMCFILFKQLNTTSRAGCTGHGMLVCQSSPRSCKRKNLFLFLS